MIRERNEEALKKEVHYQLETCVLRVRCNPAEIDIYPMGRLFYHLSSELKQMKLEFINYAEEYKFWVIQCIAKAVRELKNMRIPAFAVQVPEFFHRFIEIPFGLEPEVSRNAKVLSEAKYGRFVEIPELSIDFYAD